MLSKSTLLLIVSLAWAASELRLSVWRRAGGAATRRDEGSLPTLLWTIYGAVAAAIFVATRGWGSVHQPDAVFWLGLGTIVLGVVVRWWAIRTLREFFTVDVAIHADHRIVRAGPYRYVRHPAYTGTLLSFLGLSLALSNWISGLLLMVPVTLAFLHRIRVEERALHAAMPDEYADYAAKTARLLPGVF